MTKLYLREWRHAETKAHLPPGPWQEEADHAQWIDEATGLDCMLNRNGAGVWCGYVGVPPTHPDFKRHYDKVDVDVHGGLTFADFCYEAAPEGHGVCHRAPFACDNVWWLGFDCGHSGDLMPGALRVVDQVRVLAKQLGLTRRVPFTGDFGEEYRTQSYAEREVTQLAQQLHAHISD